MTWLAGVVSVTVTDPGAEPIHLSCLQLQRIESTDGSYVLDTGPVDQLSDRKEAVSTLLKATPAANGKLDLALEIDVERERRPALFLHDELRMNKGDAVTLTEGPLSVTVSLDLCDASTSCLSVMAAAASAVCGD